MILRPHQQRALDAMNQSKVGQIYVPTGGGKTFIMIAHAMQLLQSETPQTIVVVAPRILLANQLQSEFCEFITNARIAHVHSGDTNLFSTTKPDEIASAVTLWRSNQQHTMLFTTYHSLDKIVASGIHVDCIYFDEAHNGCQRRHFIAVDDTSKYIDRRYYFTATPRMGRGSSKHRGMDNAHVWGNVLLNVPAPELIESGSIVPPQIVPFECDEIRTKENAHWIDCDTVIDVIESLDSDHDSKILVAAPNTRVLWNMLSQTDLMDQLSERGYDILHITSKHGAYVNKDKVTRQVFFDTLTEWGKDNDRKFVIFHYSILSEGINVPGLTHTLLLRNLPVIEMAQTIGRVIRVHRDDVKMMQINPETIGQFSLYRKPCGFVTVPMHKLGKSTHNRLQRIVDSIFIEGVPPLSFA
tara:strand:- start:3054 stop:4289 length:1236 start_codon:yes stop_codon:yes gene_type:complete